MFYQFFVSLTIKWATTGEMFQERPLGGSLLGQFRRFFFFFLGRMHYFPYLQDEESKNEVLSFAFLYSLIGFVPLQTLYLGWKRKVEKTLGGFCTLL